MSPKSVYSARSISTMCNQPYVRKREFSKRKPSILRPKIARQYNNTIDYTHVDYCNCDID